MRNVIFATILTFSALTTFGQTAAGGVGNTSDNRFWLDATQLGNVNGITINSWTNDGGNPVGIVQNTASRQPILSTGILNGYHSVDFDGTNDYIRFGDNDDMCTGGNWIQRSYFIVFTTGTNITRRQMIFDEGGGIRGFNFYLLDGELHYGAYNTPNDGVGAPWGPFFSSTPIAANTTYILSFIYDGNNTTTGTIRYYLDNTLIHTFNNVGRFYSHNNGVIGAKDETTYYHDLARSGGRGHYFEGSVSEFIHYNYPVNEAQRIVINNYLSAKYGQNLIDNDFYIQDDVSNGNYDHDVAGIGRVDATNQHTDAQNRSIIRINNPQDLDDNEFMIWGHNDGVARAIEDTDIPMGVEARFDRVWRINEVNHLGNSVDVGMVDMLWDLTGLIPVTSPDLALLIDTDNDGTFADEVPILGATRMSPSNDVYMFQFVMGLANGTRFTLATTDINQTPLPIELTNFDAYPTLQKDVVLEWETKTELNNEYFSIERSVDAMNWEIIGRVEGAGTSTYTQEYTFLDEQAREEISYYRIQQIDFDGSYSYSEIKSVYIEIQENVSLNIYPNPTRGLLRVELTQITVDEVLVFDMMGHDLTNSVFLQQENSNIVTIDMQNLSGGMYLIQTPFGTRIVQKN